MSPEDIYYAIKIVAAAIAILVAIGGGGVALGKFLFGRGGKEVSTDLAIARLNAIAEKLEKKHAEDQDKAVAQARKEGARESWERTIQERVDELDQTMNEYLKGRGGR